jgi:hypothetical protein
MHQTIERGCRQRPHVLEHACTMPGNHPRIFHARPPNDKLVAVGRVDLEYKSFAAHAIDPRPHPAPTNFFHRFL